jgi:hypothetical protein
MKNKIKARLTTIAHVLGEGIKKYTVVTLFLASFAGAFFYLGMEFQGHKGDIIQVVKIQNAQAATSK